MGTLFNQAPRKQKTVDKDSVLSISDGIIEVSKRTGLEINQVIEIWKIAEIKRKNDLYLSNGDIFDEQMSGFGELIQDMNMSIKSIADRIEYVAIKM